ncbi:MAG: hypothetical protein K8T91_08525 [Planctomycetes bacterium]|nr:hypothetical protein [Planctomycetota bacterium]
MAKSSRSKRRKRSTGGAHASTHYQDGPATAARHVASRLEGLLEEVRQSFTLTETEQRVARLKESTVTIQLDALPVIDWLERHRPSEKAVEVRQRLLFLLDEAVACVEMDIPEFAGGAISVSSEQPSVGAIKSLKMNVTASVMANSLREWADDIEIEDAQRRGAGGGKTEVKQRRKPGRRKADYPTEKREAAIAAKWERARIAREYKPTWAKANGFESERELNTLLSRVRKRKARADK